MERDGRFWLEHNMALATEFWRLRLEDITFIVGVVTLTPTPQLGGMVTVHKREPSAMEFPTAEMVQVRLVKLAVHQNS